MLLLSHPTGNANVRHALQAFYDHNLLAEFHTTVATFDDNLFGLLSGLPGGSELRRRRYDPRLRRITRQQPWRELARILSMKAGLHPLYTGHDAPFSVDAIYRRLDQAAASRLGILHEAHDGKLDGVYCYEDGALETFGAASKLGLKTYYELPTVYWRESRRIAQEEAALQPEWANTLLALKDDEEKLARKDEEISKADHIIVASRFTAGSLASYPDKLDNISVIPYGCEPEAHPVPDQGPLHPDTDIDARRNKLKALFVGQLSQAKGLSYLFEAVSLAGKSVELTLVGNMPVRNCIPLERALAAHHWIRSMPHERLMNFMDSFDVLVLPSLVEGFGMVITEALSRGLPVITTHHTGGPDLITDGKEGFIVPVRSADAIAGKLVRMQEDHDRLAAMKQAARKKAAMLDWRYYRQALAALIQGDTRHA